MAKAVMNMDSRFFILLQRYKDFLKLGNITKKILRMFPFFYNNVICGEETAKLSIN